MEKALIAQARAEAVATEAGETKNAEEAIGLSVAVSSKRKLDMISETALNCNTTATGSVKPRKDAITSALESLLRAKKSRK